MDTAPPPSRVLVVDDEPLVAGAIARIAESFGHDVVLADGIPTALETLDRVSVDVVLTDVRLGTDSGLALLRSIQERQPHVPVVLITGQATIGAAMEAIESGAYEYIAKPPDRDKIGLILRRAVEKKRMADEMKQLQGAMQARFTMENIVGRSPQMLEVFKTVARVARSSSNIMILGESGTGKEMVARTLHQQSDRGSKRFVAVNMAALAEGVLESELFGHRRGAFTGATESRDGVFREAHQGTLFLDEIGDLPLSLQAKLLRAIQEQRVRPVGANEEVEARVRILTATNRDIEHMVEEGTFRQDLYYRLNVVQIQLPPLRDRRDDIALLIDHFLRKYETETARPAPRLSEDARDVMMRYAWPGNVRELENVVERAALYATHGSIGTDCLPPRLQGDIGTIPASEPFLPLEGVIDRYVDQVLAHTQGNITAAARILQVSRRTLHRMAEKRRLARPD
jgi:DNA-binding NtrC family response regulator